MHDSRQAGLESVLSPRAASVLMRHKFVPQVIEQGAAGVLSEQEPPADWNLSSESESGLAAAWLQVDNVRRAMAVAAAAVHHHPSKELQLVGITGTNADHYSLI